MKIGTMFNDILRSFFSRHTTQLYPVERIPPPERYRGILSYRPSLCTGCSLCVKDCPSDAIELVILDRAAKKYVVNYHMDRCIYCGQCVVNYKFKCISMSSQDVIETGQAPENRTGGCAVLPRILCSSSMQGRCANRQALSDGSLRSASMA